MKYVTLQTVNMKLTFYTLALISISNGINGAPNGISGDDNDINTYLSRLIADLWLEGTDVVRIIWRDCSKKLIGVKDTIDHKEYYPKFVRCMKRKTLKALDRCLSPDVVPIAEGVNLVRFELVDHLGNVLHDNETSSWTEKELEEGEWRDLVLKRLAKVLRTHVIKFDFEDNGVIDKVEYRGRRRHQFVTMMMFGIVSIGMVLVPMGFQFLAVLGGKALLLAKMALILASIQGLRKITASPISYGFYPSYPFDHYDKRSRDWPPSVDLQHSTHLHSPFIEPGDIKADRITMADPTIDKDAIEIGTEVEKEIAVEDDKGEARIFPIYTGGLNLQSPSIFTVVDAPSPLVDLTTRPGEVQADYALELPYNGFHFQSPAAVVST